jgi:hypothetical protein
MEKEQIRQLFNTFLSHYDAEAKDGIWAKQSDQFKAFWNDKILSREKGELDDAEIDRIVRILDKNGKGNTRESESVARAMIPQGAWRRMFNDIKARKELSGAINSIFLEHDLNKKAALINKLYKLNAERRNNLTGQSGNALNAMLAAFDPLSNLSVISLKDRRMLYEFLELGAAPDFDSKDIGKKILLSNTGIMDYSAGLGLRASGRSLPSSTRRSLNHSGNQKKAAKSLNRCPGQVPPLRKLRTLHCSTWKANSKTS